MRKRLTPIVLGLMVWLAVGVADRCGAAIPQISNVFPDFPTDYPSAGPHLLTGEDFEPGGTEVWVWDPGKKDDEKIAPALPAGDEPPLPETPPANARRITPLDVERQVIVAPLVCERRSLPCWPKGVSRTQ